MAIFSAEAAQERTRQYGKCWMIDDLIRVRAQDEEQVPVLGYPKHEDDASAYEHFTARQLDRMVDEACRVLVAAGLEVNSRRTVALFAPSDLAFVVTFFAVFRLGCRVLMMSIRLSAPACLALLERTGCDTIVHGATVRVASALADIRRARRGGQEEEDLKLIPLPPRAAFDKPGAPGAPFVRDIADKEAEHAQLALIAHSSGSTGLPKPLHLAHRSLLNNLVHGTGCKAFNALPWYHVHGLITSCQAIYMRKTAYLYNASLPLTADNLVASLQAIRPEICHTVPYVLKLMAEQQAGLEVLKGCKFVTAAGARTPDELGNRLIQQNINFGVIFGLSEVGHIGDSIYREPGDDAWEYVRPYENLRAHIHFRKLDEGVFESVYLRSHPALMPVNSNSDDPPGSFHSRDLFTPHPALAHAWKYLARDDDRITLLSGEKVLPLGMEGRVRESPLVRDALMVGNDRLTPALLVFRAPAAAGLADPAFVEAIWPHVRAANEVMDEYARIAPDMIAPVAPDVEYPVTDKNNIIRAAAAAKFADVIEGLYSQSAGGGPQEDQNGGGKNLQLDVAELETYVLRLLREQAGLAVPDAAADFFAAGVDSLRAAQVRRLLQRDLDLGGHALPTNVIYDAGNAAKLARVLYSLRTGQELTNGHAHDESEIAQMERLVAEYGAFEPRKPGDRPRPDKETVVLTGATGALGAHILDQLLDDPQVERVYCLVRGSDPLSRITASLDERGLSLGGRATRAVALRSDDLGAPNLGLDPAAFATLQATTTLILHGAWPVNFNISLASFAPQIAGLRNLLRLALAVPFAGAPARLAFVSSVSAAFGAPAGARRVAEGPIASLAHAAPTGYGRSKLVGERICAAAAAAAAGGGGASVAVLRVGQIAADSARGIWNAREHVPLLVRAAAELGALPRLPGAEDRCAWMPVDAVAGAVRQLAATLPSPPSSSSSSSGGGAQVRFYNVVPPHAFSWRATFLPALRAAGLRFEAVALEAWLGALRTRAAELGGEAEKVLPAVKLADYYEQTYGAAAAAEAKGEEPLAFENAAACRDSEALARCPRLDDVEIVRKMLDHWLGGTEDGGGAAKRRKLG
ncbi:hypothetical protein F4780DRAFT_794068 [Xylariomycetidae sp. FL0641]|nr:hypothetical protein F4780DRAFT_794068 [Xylariomycetidae sp. FL0641]